MLAQSTSLFTYIYMLIEPTTLRPRYVGQTTDPKDRLRRHRHGRGRTVKDDWVRSLIALGVMPEMVIIDCVAIDHADAREHYWVTALCAGGYDLLNTQLGWKKRRAVAKYNPARNAKISAALTGRKLSAEHIENIRLSRVTVQLPPPEPDRGMKISLAKKGKRFSDAHRAAISAAKKGKPWSALQRAGAQRAAAQRAAAKA